MNNMKTIIAPTDFSFASLNAARYAADLAVSVNASLLLVNVVPLPVMAGGYASETTLAELEEDAREELDKLKNQLLLRTKEKITIDHFSDFGTLEYELEDICQQESPFAVVMSPRNSTELERFFTGSNTLRAVRHIPFPILVIPATASFQKIRKIAVACDLEHTIAQHAIDDIKEWVSSLKASVDIINVSKKTDFSSTNLAASISLQNQLGEFDPAFHFIKREKVDEGIDEYIEKNKPDLLIVLPKNRGAFENFFHKSNSIGFLLHSSIPVLAIAE
jgi:nucleotide-binding universal stress UspA family protein